MSLNIYDMKLNIYHMRLNICNMRLNIYIPTSKLRHDTGSQPEISGTGEVFGNEGTSKNVESEVRHTKEEPRREKF